MRFPDLTEHARSLSRVLQQTVEEMAQEAMLLRKHDRPQVAIKNVVEMPGRDAERIIHSLKPPPRATRESYGHRMVRLVAKRSLVIRAISAMESNFAMTVLSGL